MRLSDHKPGVEVRPGVFTTHDPKYDFDVNLKRMVSAYSGKPIPDHIPAFTFLARDPDAHVGIRAYVERLINKSSIDREHVEAAVGQLARFCDFAGAYPNNMREANTEARDPKEQVIIDAAPSTG
jgi:hypothetical protein